MNSDGPQTLSCSLSRKPPSPPSIEILGLDQENKSSQSIETTPQKQSDSSSPRTPRHRRSNAHVDPAAALDAWNSSPKGREFAKSPKELFSDMSTTSQFEFDTGLPYDPYAPSPFRDGTAVARPVLDTWIQAGPEHGIDVIDWAVHANKKIASGKDA